MGGPLSGRRCLLTQEAGACILFAIGMALPATKTPKPDSSRGRALWSFRPATGAAGGRFVPAIGMFVSDTVVLVADLYAFSARRFRRENAVNGPQRMGSDAERISK